MVQIFQSIVFRFISIILLQILVFNNIPLFNFSIPYVYVLFLIILPFEINNVLLLFLGFFSGILVDLSLDSLGVHAGASVFMVAARPYILRYIALRGGYLVNTQPLLSDYGMAWFLKYAIIMVSIHHVVLYFYYSFSFVDYGFLMWRVIVNILTTLFLILLSQFFVFRK